LNHVTAIGLYLLLALSFVLCAFCAASETGLLSLNRYRLRHLAKTDPRARRISKLLTQPDRLLGVILIGNTFATAMGSSIANELAGRAWGEIGIWVSPFIFTLALLVIAEATPKTLAALKPDSTANFVSLPLQFVLVLLYPLVWVTTTLSNALLRMFGVKHNEKPIDSLNTEELRTIVNEAAGLIPSRHQTMLLSILDLEKVRVDHIMIPRNEVVGINLDEDHDAIISKLTHSQHTLLPVYRSDLDNVLGIFHTRNLAKVLTLSGYNETALLAAMDESYFIPEGTTLHTQLINFQENKRRMALIVDEYGDVLGLVTLEDILEEIVGEFTTDVANIERTVHPQDDGSFLVDGGASVRDLNRAEHWELPIEGPTTLNGLILEMLESIPEEGTCILIEGYPIEVVEVKDNAVKVARISARLPNWDKQSKKED
jgi:Mg2+/Co2+ transporter CorB